MRYWLFLNTHERRMTSYYFHIHISYGKVWGVPVWNYFFHDRENVFLSWKTYGYAQKKNGETPLQLTWKSSQQLKTKTVNKTEMYCHMVSYCLPMITLYVILKQNMFKSNCIWYIAYVTPGWKKKTQYGALNISVMTPWFQRSKFKKTIQLALDNPCTYLCNDSGNTQHD